MNMDVSKIEAAVTPRTKAVIAVHLHGLSLDMDAILAVGLDGQATEPWRVVSPFMSETVTDLVTVSHIFSVARRRRKPRKHLGWENRIEPSFSLPLAGAGCT